MPSLWFWKWKKNVMSFQIDSWCFHVFLVLFRGQSCNHLFVNSCAFNQYYREIDLATNKLLVVVLFHKTRNAKKYGEYGCRTNIIMYTWDVCRGKKKKNEWWKLCFSCLNSERTVLSSGLQITSINVTKVNGRLHNSSNTTQAHLDFYSVLHVVFLGIVHQIHAYPPGPLSACVAPMLLMAKFPIVLNAARRSVRSWSVLL